jgi:hypothetical protein
MKRIKPKEPAGTPSEAPRTAAGNGHRGEVLLTRTDRKGRIRLANGNGKGKLRLLTRDDLDQRTRAIKQFDAIATGIAADLGGADCLTTVQKLLVEAMAGASVTLADINARVLAGQPVDLAAYAQTVSTLVRVASRLGTGRVPKDVTPDPLTYARQYEHADEAAE